MRVIHHNCAFRVAPDSRRGGEKVWLRSLLLITEHRNFSSMNPSLPLPTTHPKDGLGGTGLRRAMCLCAQRKELVCASLAVLKW